MRRCIRRSTDGGVYQPNHFLIRLGSDTPFIRSGEPLTTDNPHFPLFFHEYWHYWCNISTLSGFKNFAFVHHLMSHFSATLMSKGNGESTGAADLNERQREDAATLARLTCHLEGDADATVDHVVAIQVGRIDEFNDDTSFRTGVAPNPRVLIELAQRAATGATTAHFSLGAIAIEESLAFLLEQRAAAAFGHQVTPAPLVPYDVLGAVAESKLGYRPGDYFLASMATLALLSTHPGPALMKLLDMAAPRLESGASEAEVVEKIVRVGKPVFAESIERVLLDDLVELQNMHRNRGLLEGASKTISERIKGTLQLRKEDPLFDIRPIFGPDAAAAIASQLDAHPSCEVLQESDANDGPQGDFIASFTEDQTDEFGNSTTDYIRAFQAQQHYMSAHFPLETGEFLPSDSVEVEGACPYFSACPLRESAPHPDSCAARPWKAFEGSQQTCWYGGGVAATLGTVRMRRMAPSAR